ncbi:stage III sporulation protein AG [Paenibacillus sp. RU4T]|uniref:stage III sporulation protein AG n=1 Tax=unclassified Paenibacillus TaxID=185978 RepID=UPI0009565163|nr:stage III sporulation protein AG [Paenibacillus sp. RU4X]SIQ73002.1 stage III sporulation protein AG [Paenibacillus sp. RU4T]
MVGKWLEKLEQLAGGGPAGPGRVKALRWLLLLGCIGAALMIAGSLLDFRQVGTTGTHQGADPPAPGSGGDQSAFIGKTSPDGTDFSSIEQPLENRLKEILEQIVGVGTVKVLVTVDSTEEMVWGVDPNNSQSVTDESDKNGGKRHMTQVTSSGKIVMYEVSGEQKPVVTKIIKPKIRGVLVVANGAENAAVRRIMTEAVEKGMDVPLSAISIVPRKTG